MATKGKTYKAHAVGRRKTSIARVYLADGSGKITINGRELKNYFPKDTTRYIVEQPFALLSLGDKFDVNVNVRGGGMTGQAGAIRLGLSRAILSVDASKRGELKKAGFLTRDARKVERKKYGLSGARKSYQFSKR